MKEEKKMGEDVQVIIESKFPLKGTLTVPNAKKEKYPAILLIAGTGQSDRDGNIKGLEINLYKELADYFTSLGFITLRYDKRGTHESGGDYYATGVHDLIEDAVACVQFLKMHPKVDRDRVILLGHSEGALLAPAVNSNESVSGVILLAGAAESGKDFMPRQFQMAMKELKETKGFKGFLFKLLKVVEKAQKQQDKVMEKIMSSSEPVMRIKGAKINAKWMREQVEYNVSDYLPEIHCPVLAVTGDKDIQVPPEHAEKLASMVSGPSEWHMIKDMNHILRKYPSNHTMLGLMKEYKSLVGQSTDEDLLQVFGNWLRRFTEHEEAV